MVISCTDKLNLEYLKDRMWESLNMIRVFTKKPGEKPNLADEEGIILRNGATVEHCCHAVHRSIKVICVNISRMAENSSNLTFALW